MIDPVFQPHIWDYVLVAFFALAMPLWIAVHTLPRIRALSPAQQEELRPRIYVSAMISHWMMAAAALSPLFIGSADMTTLGLGFPLEFVPNLGLALALVFVVGLFIYMQRRRVMAMPDGRALVRDAIRRFDWILPRTRRQRTLWVFVSIHAGVCEEMFFRGFLLAMACDEAIGRPPLTFSLPGCWRIVLYWDLFAPVAQLDRAVDF